MASVGRFKGANVFIELRDRRSESEVGASCVIVGTAFAFGVEARCIGTFDVHPEQANLVGVGIVPGGVAEELSVGHGTEGGGGEGGVWLGGGIVGGISSVRKNVGECRGLG